jgi:glucose/arabinose dehydrogenase
MPEPSRTRTTPRSGLALLASCLAALVPGTAGGQSASGLFLPGGYGSVVYHAGFPSPLTALALDGQGRACVGMLDGEIRILVDANLDGIAESSTVFWSNAGSQFTNLTDILWIGTKLYVCHLGTVSTLEDTNGDDVADVLTHVVTNIPYGFHQNNGLLQDGPGHLLITNGSATDVGPEPNPLNATVLRTDLNGTSLTVHCSGLRNTFRLARHPVTGDVFGGDNEWNAHPSLPLMGDEINRIVAGGDYGYPAFFGPPQAPSTTVAPSIMLPARVAPTGLAFNPNLKISGYKDELFMTLFTQVIAAALIRVPVWYGPVSGTPAGLPQLFASGFVNPIDVEFLPDGSMLVADFTTKIVHRIHPLNEATITIEAPPTIGSYCPIRLRSPSHGGKLVFMGASHAAYPATVLNSSIVVYLDVASSILTLSTTPGNGIFDFPVPGVLNASGEYLAGINVPPLASIVGYTVWLSYVVLDQSFLPLAAAPEQAILILPVF